MKLGIIGYGCVGGTLGKWFEKFTTHEIKKLDPLKGLNDNLEGCEAIFICIPIKTDQFMGQDLTQLKLIVSAAKFITPNIFIKSTVLPGTNDQMQTISMPEFLTERNAFEEMCRLPILSGHCEVKLLEEIFPHKKLIIVRNQEAELAKYAHNCFGATKVTYFNMIKDLSSRMGLDFERVKEGMFLTGFIEKTHTQVPGPDGQFGYGGKCFPENMSTFSNWLSQKDLQAEYHFMNTVDYLNSVYRQHT